MNDIAKKTEKVKKILKSNEMKVKVNFIKKYCFENDSLFSYLRESFEDLDKDEVVDLLEDLIEHDIVKDTRLWAFLEYKGFFEGCLSELEENVNEAIMDCYDPDDPTEGEDNSAAEKMYRRILEIRKLKTQEADFEKENTEI